MARDKNYTGGHSQWDLGSGKTRIQVIELSQCVTVGVNKRELKCKWMKRSSDQRWGIKEF